MAAIEERRVLFDELLNGLSLERIIYYYYRPRGGRD